MIRFPRLCLLVAFLITAALAWQIPRLRIDVSPRMLMVDGDPAADYYDQVKERFGSDRLTVVLVKADDVFAPSVLASIARLTSGLEAIDEVTRVDSLTTVNTIKGEGDSVSTGPLIDGPIPESDAAIEALRRDALANPILVGNVFSADSHATAILSYTEGARGDPDFDVRFTARVDALIAAEHQRSGLSIYQIGEPYTQAYLSSALVGDQTYVMPLSALVLGAVLFFLFRTSHAVVIPAFTRIVSITWACGLMALLDYPVTVLTVLIPMLLISVGFAEDVHLISEFYGELEEGSTKLDAVRTAGDRLATPLLVTSFTTGVGFASLSVSDVTILKHLGQFAPIAFASNFLITLLLVPALLRYLPVPRVVRERESTGGMHESPLARVLRAIGHFDLHHRGWIVAGSGLLLVVALVGMPALRVDNDLLSFFRSGSEIHRRIEDIHRSLAGVSLFYLVMDTDEDDGAIQPRTLEAVEDLQRFLGETGQVDRTLSLADYVKLMHREMNGGDPAYFRIPDSADLIAQYLLLLSPRDVEQHVDYGQTGVNILVRHNLTATQDLDALLARIDDYVATHVDPSLHVTASGEGILTGRAADSMARNMVTGLSYTIAIVGIVCSLFFMSIRAGLLSLIPNILPIGFILGLMGLLDIALNVGTTMIAAIAVGIAVDDTVHYMARNSIELDRHNDQEIATLRTLDSEGRAIVATSVALAGGFLTLTLSTFVPTAYFGALSAVVMLVALAADLTITPALMSSTRLITLWNVVGLKMRGDIVEIAPLLHGFSRWEARKVVLMGSLTACAAGDYLIRQGDRDTDSMYLVVTGSLRVSRRHEGHERVLARLGQGAVFGEMALVDTRERSADVVAETPTEVLRLTAADLDRLRRRFPRTALKLFRNLATILSARLRDTSQAAMSSPLEREHAA